MLPELAAEWHPTKNGDLTPKDVPTGSSKRATWRCVEGHEWIAIISSRAGGRGCPTCAKTGFDPNKPGILYFLVHQPFSARKIGITNEGTTRLADFSRAGWQAITLTQRPNGQTVFDAETALFRWIRKDLQLPPYLGRTEMKGTGGWSETFSMEGPSDAEIIARIEAEFAKLEQSIE
jgi:hypothetical protein